MITFRLRNSKLNHINDICNSKMKFFLTILPPPDFKIFKILKHLTINE
jgi:hypothetical protein